jgi:hypothetical protein
MNQVGIRAGHSGRMMNNKEQLPKKTLKITTLKKKIKKTHLMEIS